MKFICKQCADSFKPCIVDIGDYSCLAPEGFDCVLRSRNKNCKWERLPELTAEVFDREDCPKWARFAFVGSCGSAFFIDIEPKMSEDGIMWSWNVGARRQPIPGVFDESDWQNSLIERPEKKTLPDWCKPGEWGFDPDMFTYFKIKQIDGRLVYVQYQGNNFLNDRQVSAFKRFKQSRLRPYNAEEMRGLVGKVIESKDYTYFINAYDKGLQEVVSGGDGYTAKALLEFGYTIDGKPCGVFEHLNEKGKWEK